jgi:hypothetical protein
MTLIPGTSRLTSPIHFRRNQDFYLSTNIQFDSNQSLTIEPKWTIYKNDSSEVELHPNTFTELYVPARTLAVGLYEFHLKIPSFNLSKSLFVKIIPSGTIANLVPWGTSMITRGYRQDLKLDPGTFSVDLDGYPVQTNVSFSKQFICLLC